MTYCKCFVPIRNGTGGIFCLSCNRKLRPSLADLAEWTEMRIIDEADAEVIRRETAGPRNAQTVIWLLVFVAVAWFS